MRDILALRVDAGPDPVVLGAHAAAKVLAEANPLALHRTHERKA
jgi:hypothetical protein